MEYTWYKVGASQGGTHPGNEQKLSLHDFGDRMDPTRQDTVLMLCIFKVCIFLDNVLNFVPDDSFEIVCSVHLLLLPHVPENVALSVKVEGEFALSKVALQLLQSLRGMNIYINLCIGGRAPCKV
jgi:hypothetical protein